MSDLFSFFMENRSFLYEENHSLGEWFKRSLMAMMQTSKLPLL